MEIIDFFFVNFSFCVRCAIFFIFTRVKDDSNVIRRKKKAREMIFAGTPTEPFRTVWIIYFNDTVLMSFVRGAEWVERWLETVMKFIFLIELAWGK